MASAILQLDQLQYSVDITDFDLLNISAANVNGTIQGHFNACLDYASRFPGLPPLTASAFETCEGDFKTDATSVGVASNPAVAFFYLLTAVHGLHLLGGLFVWGKTVTRMARPGAELIDVRSSVELCTVYWHFLLLVWLVLFAVLLST